MRTVQAARINADLARIAFGGNPICQIDIAIRQNSQNAHWGSYRVNPPAALGVCGDQGRDTSIERIVEPGNAKQVLGRLEALRTPSFIPCGPGVNRSLRG